MFKKPNRNKNIRRGETSLDQIDQDDAGEKVEKPIKPPKAALLSFVHDDEENEVLQVKKSSLSRRLKKEKKKKNHKSLDAGKQVPPSTSIPSQHSSRNEIEIRSDDGLSIRLKKSHKEEKFEVEKEIEDLTMDDEDETEEKFSSSHAFIGHTFREGVIPDAAAIHAARKSRQRAREQGDFIALSNKKDDPKEEKKRKEIFSEEEVDSADEYENMLTYSKNDKNKRHETFQSVDVDGSDDDEMNEDWEAQQVRKVVTKAKLNSLNNLPFTIIPSNQNLFSNSPMRDDKTPLTTAQLLEQAYSDKRMENLSIRSKDKEKLKANGIRSPRDILSLLKSKEKLVRHQNTKNVIELDEIAKELLLIRQDIVNIDNNKPVSMKNFTFYQETKNYFEDLIECLDEKLGILVGMEERFMNIQTKSCEKLIERRRQDIRDQFEEISEKARKTFTDIPMDNEKRNRRSTEREGRRMRRRKYREKLNFHEVHYEGMSSDEEIPDMELNDFKNNLAQIDEEASKLLDDVCDEFCDLSLILKKFDEWKKKDLRTYREVYAQMCLPKIVGIFARHQSISWNPLSHGFTVDKLEWFHETMIFGAQPKETMETLRNDPDVFLVPSVIEKIYVAKIARIIEKCWDPMSTSQTMKLVRLMLQLTEDYPSLRVTSRNLQSIFESITNKIKDAIKDDIFIPLLHKQIDNQFFERQFHGAVKLFRNVVSFQGIMSDKILKELAISTLFSRYLQPALNMYPMKDRITKTNLITSTLPKRSNFEIGDILVSYMKNLQSQLEIQSSSFI